MIDYGDWGEKPLPVRDPDSEPFWEAAAEGDLTIQRCSACGERQLYPRRLCRHCWSGDLSFEVVEGTGVVHSHSRIHVPGQPGYEEETPYTVALVELDLPEENPSGRAVRLISHVMDGPDDGVEVGLPVEVTFERVSEDPPTDLPVFRTR